MEKKNSDTSKQPGNRYTYCERYFKDYIKGVSGGRNRTLLIICCLALVVFLLETPGGSQDLTLVVIIATLAVIYLFFAFAVPCISARRMMKNLTLRYPSSIPQYDVVFGDTLNINDGNDSFRLPYDRVVSIVELRYFYIISIVGGDDAVFVRKDAFVNCDAALFEKLMREYCPHAVFRHYKG